jgi:glutaconyl-CoA/methylmalonyl-CoA decarboxylase subunit gamma
MKVALDGREFEVEVEGDAVVVDGRRFQVSLKGDGLTRTATVNGRAINVRLGEPDSGGVRSANTDGQVWQLTVTGTSTASDAAKGAASSASTSAVSAPRAPGRASKGAVSAQMTGRVLRVDVQPGDQVEAHALLLILEAMKMENEIRAPRAGTVKRVAVSVGDRVNSGDVLVELED